MTRKKRTNKDPDSASLRCPKCRKWLCSVRLPDGLPGQMQLRLRPNVTCEADERHSDGRKFSCPRCHGVWGVRTTRLRALAYQYRGTEAGLFAAATLAGVEPPPVDQIEAPHSVESA